MRCSLFILFIRYTYITNTEIIICKKISLYFFAFDKVKGSSFFVTISFMQIILERDNSFNIILTSHVTATSSSVISTKLVNSLVVMRKEAMP